LVLADGGSGGRPPTPGVVVVSDAVGGAVVGVAVSRKVALRSFPWVRFDRLNVQHAVPV